MVVTFEQLRTKKLKTFDELRAKPKSPDYGTAAIPKERLPGVWDYDKQLDDLLGDPEIDIEKLMPLDVRYDFGKIVGMTEKPDETKDRMATSLFYSVELGIPPSVSFSILDELNKTAFDKSIPASNAWGRIKQRYRTGKAEVQLMDMGFDILKGTWQDWEKYDRSVKNIEKLQSGMTVDQRKEFRNFFEKLVGASAELAPFGLEAAKEMPLGAGIGGTLFGIGAALATAAIPTVGEEIPAITTAVLTGMKLGAGVRGAIRVGQLEAGGMFLELANMKDQYGNRIDPQIAVVASHAVGAINGGIELAEWQVLLGTFGIGKKLFDKSVRKVTHRLFTQGTLKELIARKALDYSIALGAETLQEIEQETTNVIFGELAKELNDAREGTDFKPITSEDLKARYQEVTVESMRAFGLMVLPGTTVSGALEFVAQKKAEAAKKAEKPGVVEVKAPPTEAITAPSKPVEPITTPEAKITPAKAESYWGRPELKEEYTPKPYVKVTANIVVLNKQGEMVGTKKSTFWAEPAELKDNRYTFREVTKEGTKKPTITLVNKDDVIKIQQALNNKKYGELEVIEAKPVAKAEGKKLKDSPATLIQGNNVDVFLETATKDEVANAVGRLTRTYQELRRTHPTAFELLPPVQELYESAPEGTELYSPEHLRMLVGGLQNAVKTLAETGEQIPQKLLEAQPVAKAEPVKLPKQMPPAEESWKYTEKEWLDMLEKETGFREKPLKGWAKNVYQDRIKGAIERGETIRPEVVEQFSREKWAQEYLAQPVAKAVVKKEVSPIVEPELTKQEEADIARLETEIEEPFEMVRVKGVGFVIKEKATGKEAVTIAKRKEAKAKIAEYNKGERKIRETRRKPKLLTGKATIGKLITEARALKAAMKKAAQAARKAYQVGKGEGIAKVKAYYYDIRQREQARKQLKERITKAVKTITKDIPKSVDFKYREAIENLQAGIDPQFRMKKTLRMRERTREFLAQSPEALKDMPVKLLKKLAQKPMSEYTIEEVEKIAEEIERLTKQGKLKRKLRLAQKERKLTKTTQEITETVSKGEKIEFESEPVTYEISKQGFIKTTFEKVKAWTWRPSRIFDMLDGMKDFTGKAHHTFIDQVNTAINAKLRAVDKRKDAGIAKMKELGITSRDLAQVRTIGDVRYMIDEMIGIYCASKNRLAKLALMYGNNLNEKTIDNVIANLTENEKAWGDFIISEYETRYDVLREKVIEVENRDMGYEENYIPIRRTEVDYSTHTEEIIDAILQREHLRRAYAEHGFTIHRKEVPAEFQKPIRLNVTGVWASQISKQEQYIHLAELVRDLHKIASDRDFRAAVEQQFGKEFNKIIKNYIDRVANPNIYKSYNALENLSRRLRQNAVIAYLAYNLVTMAKQVPSVFLYLQDAGPTHLISSAMQFVEHPLKMVDMVREKDPQVKHRAIERELEEMKLRNPEMYNNMLAKFGKAGMEGIYLFDAVARTIGWNAVYQKAMKSDMNMSEAEAVRLAQNATLRTQPAAAAKDVAQLYATNEFANWFTMFTNQLNQIYNIATYDMSGYLKNKDYQKYALAATGMSITALTIWIITHRRLPESKEDWVDVAAEQSINAVPLVGKAIMAGKRGWGGTEIPAFELPKAVGRALSAVAEGKFDENDIKAIAEGIAVVSGTPYIGPKRVIKTVDTGEIKELIGGEPIRKKKRKPKKITW